MTLFISTFSNTLIHYPLHFARLVDPFLKKILSIALAAFELLKNCLYRLFNIPKIDVKKASLGNVPTAIKQDMMGYLDFRSNHALSLVNKEFATCYRQPKVMAALIEQSHHLHLINFRYDKFALEAKLQLIKQAGTFLHSLDLHYWDVSNEQFREILKACPHIKHFNLSDCAKLTVDLFDGLPADIQSLKLGSWTLNDQALSHFSKHLHSLDLSYCIGFSQHALSTLLKKSQNLVSLNLTCCQVNLEGLPRSLESIHLNGIKTLNDNDLDFLPDGLKSLHLAGNANLTGEGLVHLFKRLQKLQCLNLTSLNITDEILEALSNNLNSLKITICNVTHQTLVDLLKRLHHLRHLELSIIQSLENKSIDFHLPAGLERLTLSFSYQITEASVIYLPESLKYLKFLAFSPPSNLNLLKELSKRMIVEF